MDQCKTENCFPLPSGVAHLSPSVFMSVNEIGCDPRTTCLRHSSNKFLVTARECVTRAQLSSQYIGSQDSPASPHFRHILSDAFMVATRIHDTFHDKGKRCTYCACMKIPQNLKSVDSCIVMCSACGPQVECLMSSTLFFV